MTFTEFILSLILSVFASTGFWTFVNYRIQKRDKNKDALTRLMLGLAHDRIIEQATRFEERGYITEDEYGDFKKYLYDPYIELGGDGTAEKIYEDNVKTLPIKLAKDL